MRLFVGVLGAGLLLDGVLRFDVLHIGLGVALLTVSAFARNGQELRAVWAAVFVGALLVALGVVGLTIDQPFGLQLGLSDNVFHLVMGVLALAFGAFALRSIGRVRQAPAPVTTPSTVAPVGMRSARPARHRPRRKPTHGHQRRR